MKTRKIIKSIQSYCLLLPLLAVLTACGGGSSSSGSGKDYNAVDCVTLRVMPSSTNIVNSCSYAINIREITANIPQGAVHQIAANSQITIATRAATYVTYGACKAPHTPEKANDKGEFRCV